MAVAAWPSEGATTCSRRIDCGIRRLCADRVFSRHTTYDEQGAEEDERGPQELDGGEARVEVEGGSQHRHGDQGLVEQRLHLACFMWVGVT
jgi:hypothetical protein